MNEILKLLKKGFKENLIPGLILQSFGLVLVLAYYFAPGVKESLEGMVVLKQKYPYEFSALSTSLFGGLIPYVILWKKKSIRASLSLFIFFILFWAFKGVETELFYTFQAWFFGTSFDPFTIVKKVLFDQFIWSVFYTVPTIVLIYKWKDSDFSLRKMKKDFSFEWFRLAVLSVIVPNWLVWIPSCAIIYLMPVALQVPLFNIIMCFYVLVLEILCKKEES